MIILADDKTLYDLAAFAAARLHLIDEDLEVDIKVKSDLDGLMFGYMIGVTLLTALSNLFYAGILKMIDDAEHNKNVAIDSLFHYFRSNYFVQLLLSGFILGVLATFVLFLFEYINLSWLGSLFQYAISFFTVLTIPLIIFSNIIPILSNWPLIWSAISKFFSFLAFSRFSIKSSIFLLIFSSSNSVNFKPNTLSKSFIKIIFSLFPSSLSLTTAHKIDKAIGMFKSSLIAFKNKL
jgi:hypothetical protein